MFYYFFTDCNSQLTGTIGEKQKNLQSEFERLYYCI